MLQKKTAQKENSKFLLRWISLKNLASRSLGLLCSACGENLHGIVGSVALPLELGVFRKHLLGAALGSEFSHGLLQTAAKNRLLRCFAVIQYHT